MCLYFITRSRLYLTSERSICLPVYPKYETDVKADCKFLWCPHFFSISSFFGPSSVDIDVFFKQAAHLLDQLVPANLIQLMTLTAQLQQQLMDQVLPHMTQKMKNPMTQMMKNLMTQKPVSHLDPVHQCMDQRWSKERMSLWRYF